MGQLVSSTCRFWILYTTMALSFVLKHFEHLLGRMYILAHGPSLSAKHAKLYLQYAFKIKSLPKHPTHDIVFDNKYLKFFDVRHNAIHTFHGNMRQVL